MPFTLLQELPLQWVHVHFSSVAQCHDVVRVSCTQVMLLVDGRAVLKDLLREGVRIIHVGHLLD